MLRYGLFLKDHENIETSVELTNISFNWSFNQSDDLSCLTCFIMALVLLATISVNKTVENKKG